MLPVPTPEVSNGKNDFEEPTLDDECSTLAGSKQTKRSKDTTIPKFDISDGDYDSGESDIDEHGDNLLEILQQMELDEEMEEAMTATQDGNMIADENGWGKFASRQKHFDFTGEKGVKGDIPPTITALELFSLFIDDEVIDLIVTNTNIYAEELKLRKEDQKYAPIQRWTPTNREEIRKFLILTVWMGLVPIGNLKDYWATQSIIYKFEYPQSIMSQNRY